MHNDDQFSKMRNGLGEAVSEMVQVSISQVLHTKGPQGIPDALYLGLNTALYAMTVVLPFLAQKPNLTPEQVKQIGGQELIKTLTYERLLFAALIISRMQGDVTVNRTLTEGVELAAEVNFGPSTFGEALEDWKKLTNKNPADFFDARLLEAIETMERETKAPFDKFLAARQNSPTSKTLN